MVESVQRFASIDGSIHHLQQATLPLVGKENKQNDMLSYGFVTRLLNNTKQYL